MDILLSVARPLLAVVLLSLAFAIPSWITRGARARVEAASTVGATVPPIRLVAATSRLVAMMMLGGLVDYFVFAYGYSLWMRIPQ